MSDVMAKPALDAGIVTANPEPLIRFYEAVFGLARLEPLVLPSIGTIHKLAVGESVLRIMEPDEKPGPNDAAWSAREGVRYLTFEVVDASAVTEAARANGGEVVLEPFELRPGRVVCQINDPDGNMLEVGQG